MKDTGPISRANTFFIFQRWNISALFFLLLAACMGLLMRYMFVAEVSWVKFKNLMQAHSHIALLGWGYSICFALLVRTFVPAEKHKGYSWLFIASALSVVPLILTFPAYGYKAPSIIFLSIHLILSYIFVYRILKDSKVQGEKRVSTLFGRSAARFLVVSTIGLWALPVIMQLEGKHSAIYYMAIQFFLHFQFNGWFTFSVLALLFHMLEKAGLIPPRKKIYPVYVMLVISTVLTYALAVAWSTPLSLVFYTNTLGVLLQSIAFGSMIYFLWRPVGRLLSFIVKEVRVYFLVGLFSLFAKIAIQSAVVIPFIAVISYTIRNYIIGFIHLILLGSLSFFVLAYSFSEGFLQYHRPPAKWGWFIFLLGFVLSELVLFLQGTMLWIEQGYLPYYHEIIFAVSTLLPVGLLLAFLGQSRPFMTKITNQYET